jgi:uncharacterized protein (DUF1810 family)
MIDKSSSKAGGDGCDCGQEPELMRRMAMTLDSDQFLQGVERKLAADRCHECTELEACKVWLDITAIRGAVHPPKFCRNADLFEEISNDAATSSF